MNIRTEMHPFRGQQEWYAIIDDIYDGADARPLAGVGPTEAEAIADLMDAIEDMTCPYCKSGPGEPHWNQCELEYADLAYRSDP